MKWNKKTPPHHPPPQIQLHRNRTAPDEADKVMIVQEMVSGPHDAVEGEWKLTEVNLKNALYRTAADFEFTQWINNKAL